MSVGDVSVGDSWGGGVKEGAHHAVAGELGVGLQDTVCGRVVASSVHGIRASLVEGGWESHIARVPAGNCNFCHGVMLLCSPCLYGMGWAVNEGQLKMGNAQNISGESGLANQTKPYSPGGKARNYIHA